MEFLLFIVYRKFHKTWLMLHHATNAAILPAIRMREDREYTVSVRYYTVVIPGQEPPPENILSPQQKPRRLSSSPTLRGSDGSHIPYGQNVLPPSARPMFTFGIYLERGFGFFP